MGQIKRVMVKQHSRKDTTATECVLYCVYACRMNCYAVLTLDSLQAGECYLHGESITVSLQPV